MILDLTKTVINLNGEPFIFEGNIKQSYGSCLGNLLFNTGVDKDKKPLTYETSLKYYEIAKKINTTKVAEFDSKADLELLKTFVKESTLLVGIRVPIEEAINDCIDKFK